MEFTTVATASNAKEVKGVYSVERVEKDSNGETFFCVEKDGVETRITAEEAMMVMNALISNLHPTTHYENDSEAMNIQYAII